MVLSGVSLWVSELETYVEDVGLEDHALATAAGHFLRNVFGGRAQVRS